MTASRRLLPMRRAHRRAIAGRIVPAVFILALAASNARAGDAMAWLTRAAQAARELNYTGTIVYQIGPRVESSRITHLFDGGREYAKLVRVEPGTFRNVFPSLSAEQQESLSRYYDFRVLGDDRVGGRPLQVVVFDPRDGLRYGHRFWSDRATGLLLRASVLNERGEGIEQFSFSDLTMNARIEPAMVEPSWPSVPSDWQVLEGGAGDVVSQDTGWVVTRVPPGFAKIVEGYRKLRGHRERIAHIVLSDGLDSVCVFVEPGIASTAPAGPMQKGGLNIYRVRQDDHLITVMGETPGATVRQIAHSVAHR